MPVYDFNLSQLYQGIFGIRGYQVRFNNDRSPDVLFDADKVPLLQSSPAMATSLLGTPIFEAVRFRVPPLSEPFALPNAPLVDISQAKRIEKTYVAGRKGSVKEYIYLDDFRVRIRGLIINPDSHDLQPIEAIQQLYDLFARPQAVEVESALMNALGIHNLVIENIDLPDSEGFPSVQPFTLDCVSDEPFELQYNA